MSKLKNVSSRVMARMNRRMWNDISDNWQRRREADKNWRFFKRGGTELLPAVHQLMGAVRGKALLNLQCGSGEATLSWANYGAKATGVDISDARITEARKKAKLAGVKATYARGTVIRLPFRRSSFDCVYTGGGVMGWIPDIRRWAREIARVLKRGGRFVCDDSHPFLLCLVQRGDRLPTIGGHYFDQRPTVYMSMGKRGKRRLPQVERDWKLSDILNALTDAGLQLQRVLEEKGKKDNLDFRLSLRHRMLIPAGLALMFSKP